MPLLGAVLAVLLHQRGFLVLHASAVDVRSGGVIFVGDKGAGKSATAAAMVAAGHRLIADDIVAVQVDDDRRIVLQPGFPQLKLAPAAARLLLQNPEDDLAFLYPNAEKLARPVTNHFGREPVVAKRIYLLQRGRDARIRVVPPTEIFRTLMKHSYMARFGDRVLRGQAAHVHLQQCAALARAARVAVLETPQALEELMRVTRLVEAAAED